MLPATKARLGGATTQLKVADAGMGLLALGARHRALRAECRKALEGGPEPTGKDASDQKARAMCDVMLAIENDDRVDPDTLVADTAALGATFAVVRAKDGRVLEGKTYDAMPEVAQPAPVARASRTAGRSLVVLG